MGKKTAFLKDCLLCEKPFLAIPSAVEIGKDKYCCPEHGREARHQFAMAKSDAQKKICAYCGIIFTKPYNLSQQQWDARIYHSKKCGGLGRKTSKLVPCKGCGILKEVELNIIKQQGENIFHSVDCFNIYQQGRPNPKNSKGGLYNVQEAIRKSRTYERWRTSIFIRDKGICQMCNKPAGKKGNVDHYPKSFAEIFYKNNIQTLKEGIACKEFWETDNARVLCLPCHRTTLNYLKPYKPIKYYIDIKKAKKYYNLGFNLEEVAQIFGVSKHVIHYRFEQNNIPRRTPFQSNKMIPKIPVQLHLGIEMY